MTSVFFIFLSNFRARRRVALKQKKIGGSPSSLIESLSSSSSLNYAKRIRLETTD